MSEGAKQKKKFNRSWKQKRNV